MDLKIKIIVNDSDASKKENSGANTEKNMKKDLESHNKKFAALKSIINRPYLIDA